jgi:hypothetical protein
MLKTSIVSVVNELVIRAGVWPSAVVTLAPTGVKPLKLDCAGEDVAAFLSVSRKSSIIDGRM